MLELTYPVKQNIAQSNQLLKLYDRVKNTSENSVRLNLSKTESLTPFGIILLTATINECFRRGLHCSYIKPKNLKLQRFFREIGFNKFFGLPGQGQQVDKIESGIVQLRKLSGLDASVLDTLIKILDFHLKLSPGIKGSLRMSLLEAMQNVVDHSNAPDYYLCSWNYKQKKQLRLCIADAGIGVPEALKKNPKYALVENDHEAISLSTMEGVSSVKPGIRGLGLNHIKNFIKVNKGRMAIISGNGKVFWKFDRGETLNQKMEMSFSGTVLKLLINTDKEGFYFLSSESDYLF